MYKIYIIEDDVIISREIANYLEKWSYKCKVVTDYDIILKEINDFKPHITLIDVNLPKYDGFYWCKEIRKLSNVPIIFISSRNTEMDKIMSMNIGGDDYIDKPFSLQVLTAKIQALLRRTYSYENSTMNVYNYKDLTLIIEEGKLYFHDKIIQLTPNEYNIMKILMKQPCQIVKRDTIIKALWDDESFVDDNTLTVNINRLRKKLKDNNIDNIIHTVKKEGYKIE